ncbi:MAG: hypothetical protein H5T62_15130 [Anaerolineae bacterium]|nr:hypothetical protein [Anaerolineae bacterium]
MFKPLRRWFAPPVFEDEEKTRIATLLNAILIAGLSLQAVMCLGLLALTPDPLPGLASNGMLISFLLSAWFLMRRGHVRLASSLVAGVLAVFFVFMAFMSGGVFSPMFNGYIIVVVIAGMLLGGRAGIVFALLGIMASLTMLWVEVQGHLPPSVIPSGSVVVCVGVATDFLLAAVLLHLASSSLHAALERVRQSESRLLAEVAERERAEAELREYAIKLERSNRELEGFAYIASHDLKEPLRKIQAFGERLEARYGDVLDERGRDYLTRMRDAAARMQALIEGLLTYSRVTTQAQPFVQVDLNRVLHEVLSDLEVRIEQLQARVEVGELPTVEADPLQMQQLFQNLIGNALKFHREGVAPVVRVWSEQLNGSEGQYQIMVEDNGIGFDEKYVDRIFQVFQRLHGWDEYEGAGVGLAVCRKIVEEHGGTITAKGVPGQGATFVVTLPGSNAK